MPEYRVQVVDATEAAAIAALDEIGVSPYTDAELRRVFSALSPSDRVPMSWPHGAYITILRLLATLRDRGVIRFDLGGEAGGDHA